VSLVASAVTVVVATLDDPGADSVAAAATDPFTYVTIEFAFSMVPPLFAQAGFSEVVAAVISVATQNSTGEFPLAWSVDPAGSVTLSPVMPHA
jgi:hypothetical protein